MWGMIMIEQIEMTENIEMEAVSIRIRIFFRFCGVRVNYIIREKKSEDICFKVKKRDEEQRKECSVTLSPEADCKVAISTVVDTFLSNILLEDVDALDRECLLELKECYIDNKLDYHIYNLTHFHTIKEITDDGLKAFIQAYFFLNQKVEERKEQRQSIPFALTYAKIICARHVNEICNIQNRNPVFDSVRIVKELQESAEKYRVNTVVNYLAGQIMFVDPLLRDESNYYFEKALNDEIGEFFKSNIYYYIGLNTQWVKREMDQTAVNWYRKSLESNPMCYRACYKLGMYYMNKRDCKAAEKYFNTIISDMNKKECYLQPIELLYLFKANQRMALIAVIMKNDIEVARKYENDAKKLHKTTKDKNSLFMNNFYGIEKQKFYEYLCQRFDELRIEQSF